MVTTPIIYGTGGYPNARCESSLATFAYQLLGTLQDTWTGRAWYGGAVLASKVVWSQSETSPENQTVSLLRFPLSPSRSGGFHMSKLEGDREEQVVLMLAEEKLDEAGKEGEAVAVFHYERQKGGYRQDRANSPHQGTLKIAGHSLQPLSQGKFGLNIRKMQFPKPVVEPWHRETVTSHPCSYSELAQTSPEWPDAVLWVLLCTVGADTSRDPAQTMALNLL